MKVILLADIKGVGKKDQVINASDGYARNFLFPKKLAVPADAGNMGRLNNKKASESHKKELEISEAKKIAEQLGKIELIIKVKAGENGKIFGGVTNKEISEELKKSHNIDVDKKKIQLKENIKNLGRYNIDVKLYEGVVAKLTVEVKAI
ncbi:MAG: 50S ribosomal protein L9 [Clostridia bacterium]|nr:50S ribosomal protein L9 [Clostridia bacterium]